VQILDDNGEKLDSAAGLDNAIYTRLDELNPYTCNAFAAVKDKRFFAQRN